MNRTRQILAISMLASFFIYPAWSQASGGIGNQSLNREMQAFLNSNEYYPVPGDIFSLSIIVIGPGSQAFLGSQGSISYSVVLNRDYSLYLPVAGSISVKGLHFEQIRQRVIESINKRIAVDYIDFQFAIPLSFQIFVNGLVQRPGPVTASSIMRVSDIIGAVGGLAAGASSRRILLTRSDGSQQSVDIQSYLRRGDKNANPLLLPGDKISVGQALKTVRIEGAVLSPGYYELVDTDLLNDVLEFSTGLTVNAAKDFARLLRINEDGTYSTSTLDLNKDRQIKLMNGDVIRVPTATENSSFITVEGPFYGKANNGVDPATMPTSQVNLPVASSEGASLQGLTLPSPIKVYLPHYPGMNLYDIMEKLGGPTLYARGSRGRVIPAKGGEDLGFDPIELWKTPEECRKIIIYPGDYVLIPMKNQIVSIAGEVNLPRVLPYMEKRSLAEYLAYAGGIKISGDRGSIALYDASGKRLKRVKLDYIPEPEDIVVVQPNGWKAFANWWDQPGPISSTTKVLGFLSIIATLASTIITILTGVKIIK